MDARAASNLILRSCSPPTELAFMWKRGYSFKEFNFMHHRHIARFPWSLRPLNPAKKPFTEALATGARGHKPISSKKKLR